MSIESKSMVWALPEHLQGEHEYEHDDRESYVDEQALQGMVDMA